MHTGTSYGKSTGYDQFLVFVSKRSGASPESRFFWRCAASIILDARVFQEMASPLGGKTGILD